jgi:hypothetical protein
MTSNQLSTVQYGALKELVHSILNGDTGQLISDGVESDVFIIPYKKYFNLKKYDDLLKDCGLRFSLRTHITVDQIKIGILLDFRDFEDLLSQTSLDLFYQMIKDDLPYMVIPDRNSINIVSVLTQKNHLNGLWDKSVDEVVTSMRDFMATVFNKKILSKDNINLVWL